MLSINNSSFDRFSLLVGYIALIGKDTVAAGVVKWVGINP